MIEPNKPMSEAQERADRLRNWIGDGTKYSPIPEIDKATMSLICATLSAGNPVLLLVRDDLVVLCATCYYLGCFSTLERDNLTKLLGEEKV